MSLRLLVSRAATALLVVGGLVVAVGGQEAAAATVLPSGFQEQVVYSGLTEPTSVQFATDGRVFVAQKDGIIKEFDGLSDTTPTVFADLSTQVHDQWDRGLLGFVLAPNFPTDPSVYVLYTYDAKLGGTAPVYNDVCNVDGGANGGNCVVSGRLSKLTANGNQWTGTEQVLISDWCQQYPSHSVGDLKFGPDGALYVSAGEGASFNATDFGQFGNPVNPCGDPANEGGALRSQDVRSTADPTGLSGAILRLDPATGAALPTNPNFGASDPNARRIIAYGLRNPFRFTFKPGTSEIWAGDVGWNTWEEINRLTNPTGSLTNFGWPCYEGNATQSGYQSANLPLCQSLYSGAGQTAPYYAYNHGNKVVAGETCPSGSSSISGMAFYPDSGGSYPAAYSGALFFADYSRNCIWAMLKGANGLPDPNQIQTFAAGAAGPVHLNIGPGGELYYPDLGGGTVRRIRYFPNNRPPIASFTATPSSGATPLVVAFDASGSSDQDPADQGRLTYQWDFENDGTFDATGVTSSHTYATNGTFTALLKVTDTLGASSTSTVPITAGNGGPTAVIDTPASTFTWKVGDPIAFTGHATDPQDGTLPATALKWDVLLQHCSAPGTCHTHFVQTLDGVAGGSITAPDHDYPSYLQLRLTATDSRGLTSVTTVDLQPQTVNLTFASNPSGLQLTVGSSSQATPFTRQVIIGSTNSVSAPTPQTSGSTTYTFGSWNDGGGQTHTIIAPAIATTYTATYAGSAPPCGDSFGYTCVASPRAFVPAANATNLTGDDGVLKATLPFTFKFYGTNYTSVNIDNNGLLSFATPGKNDWINQAIPAAGAPNAGIYAFWDDLVVSPSGSVRTETVGTAPNRQYIVEWRNVYVFNAQQKLFSVEAILGENGTITFAYTGDFSIPVNQGSSATVGIENAAGTVALRYLYNTAGLHSGDGLVITPPGTTTPTTGSITGTVTANGTPVAGAAVATSTGARTTSAANGTYTLAGLTPGTVSVTATTTADKCAGRTGSTTATVTGGQSTTANITLDSGGSRDAFGYTCAAAPRAFTPADTTLALTGDDAYIQVTMPFPMKLYGQSSTSVYIDTDGFISTGVPTANDWISGPIPSSAKPNAGLYPFWDDLMVDGSGSVLTKTTGAAPNRQYIVEWRNVFVFDHPEHRFSFEAIISENGDIAFAYTGDMTAGPAQGGEATVGIENATGTIALQYSCNTAALRSGDGITFHLN